MEGIEDREYLAWIRYHYVVMKCKCEQLIELYSQAPFSLVPMSVSE